MKHSLKKRGQKLVRGVSRTTARLGEEGKEHIKQNFVERLSHIENVRLLIFEWLLLVTALILLAITQAFWFGDSYAQDSFAMGGTYSEATLGAVGSLNPLFATTSSEKTLSRLLFATLSANDYSGHAGLGLAQSIMPSDNGRVWTVRLREGLKWSDGEPLTNEDVLFTVSLIQNPAVKSIYDTNLAGVVVGESADSDIIFTLLTPYVDFISALNFPVLPRHKLKDTDPRQLVEDTFSTQPVTSGPFSFNALQTTATSGEKVFYLSANPYYYGGRPQLGSFAVHTYPDKDSLMRGLNLGMVTATAELSKVESQDLAGTLLAKDSALNTGAYIFFNTRSENVNRREIRAAIRQGLDLSRLRVLSPDTAPLDYPLLESQITLGHYPEIPARDAEAAKARLSELFADQRPQIEIATLQLGSLPDIAEELANQIEQLGLGANVTIYDEQNQDFIARRTYDLLVYEVGLGATPDLLPYYHSLQASSSGLNLANYGSTITDDLIIATRSTLDSTLRTRKFENFLEHWMEDVPAIGLYQANLTYVYNRNARTFANNVRLVTPLDRFVDVTAWAVNKDVKNMTP